MLAATFVFLGLAVLSVMTLVCPNVEDFRARGPHGQNLAFARKSTWREIKAAYQDRDALADGNSKNPRQTAVPSWGRTFALCAGLCLVGVVLEAEYDKRISIAQIVDDLTRPYLASVSTSRPPARQK